MSTPDLQVRGLMDDRALSIGADSNGDRVINLSSYGLQVNEILCNVESLYSSKNDLLDGSILFSLTKDRPNVINQTRSCGLKQHTYIYTLEVSVSKTFGIYVLEALCAEVIEHFPQNLLIGFTDQGDVVRCLQSYNDSNPLTKNDRLRQRVFVDVEVYRKLKQE